MTCEKCQATGEMILGHPRIILCIDCQRLIQQRTQIVSYLNTKRHKYKLDNQSVETPTKQTETPMTYSQWVIHQRGILRALYKTQPHEASQETLKYLGRLCDVCGKSCSPNAKLDLCKEHSEAYRREYKRLWWRRNHGKN